VKRHALADNSCAQSRRPRELRAGVRSRRALAFWHIQYGAYASERISEGHVGPTVQDFSGGAKLRACSELADNTLWRYLDDAYAHKARKQGIEDALK
jgi:hypothetical protein